jgi:NAD(P)H-dependent FMN reductase
MGAVLGPSGSANAQATLLGVLGRIGAIVVPDPQMLVPRASRLFDEQVDVRDEGTRGRSANWLMRWLTGAGVFSPKILQVCSRRLVRRTSSGSAGRGPRR